MGMRADVELLGANVSGAAESQALVRLRAALAKLEALKPADEDVDIWECDPQSGNVDDYREWGEKIGEHYAHAQVQGIINYK